MSKIDILGIKIDGLTTSLTLSKIKEFIFSSQPHYLVTVNPEMIIEAQKNPLFARVINTSDLNVADGIGILWAAQYLSLPLRTRFFSKKSIFFKMVIRLKALWQAFYTLLSLPFYPSYCRQIIPERVTGSDLIYKICQLASEVGVSVFFLGAREGVAKSVASKLQLKFPQLEVAGTFSGRPDKAADHIIRAIINKAQPQILFVAFGHLKQELWIKRNLKYLPSVKVALGVGGAFDHVVGKQKRAPYLLQKLGLEWFWRLITQPWRIKRIYNAVFKFIYLVVRFKIKEAQNG